MLTLVHFILKHLKKFYSCHVFITQINGQGKTILKASVDKTTVQTINI